jgi:hypothetical protein
LALGCAQDIATQRPPRRQRPKLTEAAAAAKRSQLNETLDKLSLFFSGALAAEN